MWYYFVQRATNDEPVQCIRHRQINLIPFLKNMTESKNKCKSFMEYFRDPPYVRALLEGHRGTKNILFKEEMKEMNDDVF
jgi:hypothetical protein